MKLSAIAAAVGGTQIGDYVRVTSGDSDDFDKQSQKLEAFYSKAERSYIELRKLIQASKIPGLVQLWKAAVAAAPLVLDSEVDTAASEAQIKVFATRLQNFALKLPEGLTHEQFKAIVEAGTRYNRTLRELLSEIKKFNGETTASSEGLSEEVVTRLKRFFASDKCHVGPGNKDVTVNFERVNLVFKPSKTKDIKDFKVSFEPFAINDFESEIPANTSDLSKIMDATALFGEALAKLNRI